MAKVENSAGLGTLTGSSKSIGDAQKDDRIFTETRWIGIVIVLFLAVAFVMLYFFPFNTKELFAWEIKPQMTPLLMGGGYISGSYFFIRLFMGGRWHWFTWGFLAITAFTWFMAAASLLHVDKFNGFPVAVWAWLGLYFTTPLIVPLIWLRNRVTDPGTPDPDDVIVPQTVRLVSAIAGAVILAIALFMLIFPQVGIDVWPWQLSPFTARVVGGWFALPGVVAFVLARDSRWSAWRVLLESQVIALALMLIAVARAWGDFMQDRPTTWLFVGGIALLLMSVLGLYFSMEQRRQRAVK